MENDLFWWYKASLQFLDYEVEEVVVFVLD